MHIDIVRLPHRPRGYQLVRRDTGGVVGEVEGFINGRKFRVEVKGVYWTAKKEPTQKGGVTGLAAANLTEAMAIALKGLALVLDNPEAGTLPHNSRRKSQS